MAYNNSDDGWDLFAKAATGPIGVVTIQNCIAFRNGFTEFVEIAARVGTTIAGEIRLARAFAIVVDGGAVDQCAELRVVVIRKAAVQVFKGQTILYNMSRANAAAAQLEAVTIAVAIAFAKFCKADLRRRQCI